MVRTTYQATFGTGCMVLAWRPPGGGPHLSGCHLWKHRVYIYQSPQAVKLRAQFLLRVKLRPQFHLKLHRILPLGAFVGITSMHAWGGDDVYSDNKTRTH